MKIHEARDISEEGLSLMVNKAADYSGSIDNIVLGGKYGVAIRLLDKVARLLSLTEEDSASPRVVDESIRDTFIDIMNYGNIGVQMCDGVWNNSIPENADPKAILYTLVREWQVKLARNLITEKVDEHSENKSFQILEEDDGQCD